MKSTARLNYKRSNSDHRNTIPGEHMQRNCVDSIQFPSAKTANTCDPRWTECWICYVIDSEVMDTLLSILNCSGSNPA